jgi:arsenate reductase (glutaredoxin)
MTEVVIYHNPACGTSRNTLALIRNAGVEPTVIEYLKTPSDRATLEALLRSSSRRAPMTAGNRASRRPMVGESRFRPIVPAATPFMC